MLGNGASSAAAKDDDTIWRMLDEESDAEPETMPLKDGKSSDGKGSKRKRQPTNPKWREHKENSARHLTKVEHEVATTWSALGGTASKMTTVIESLIDTIRRRLEDSGGSSEAFQSDLKALEDIHAMNSGMQEKLGLFEGVPTKKYLEEEAGGEGEGEGERGGKGEGEGEKERTLALRLDIARDHPGWPDCDDGDCGAKSLYRSGPHIRCEQHLTPTSRRRRVRESAKSKGKLPVGKIGKAPESHGGASSL
jgi:hypothetical protein